MLASAAGSMGSALGLSNGDKNKKEIEKIRKEILKLKMDDNYNQTKIRHLKNAVFRDLLDTLDSVNTLSSDLNSKYNLMRKKVNSIHFDDMDGGDPLNLEAELGIDGKEDDTPTLI